jgi:hypothetical protein
MGAAERGVAINEPAQLSRIGGALEEGTLQRADLPVSDAGPGSFQERLVSFDHGASF